MRDTLPGCWALAPGAGTTNEMKAIARASPSLFILGSFYASDALPVMRRLPYVRRALGISRGAPCVLSAACACSATASAGRDVSSGPARPSVPQQTRTVSG